MAGIDTASAVFLRPDRRRRRRCRRRRRRRRRDSYSGQRRERKREARDLGNSFVFLLAYSVLCAFSADCNLPD